MKKLFVMISGIALIGFSSCKKEYTCECTTTNGSATSIVNEKKLDKQSLKDARSKCDEGDMKIGSLETECKIKL